MIGLVRAAIFCATLSLGLISAGLPSAQAADKPFKRDDLADSAIKLEAQIKSEAGVVSKSGGALKADADAAFKRNDMRTGLQILGQIATTAPDDSGNWLRLARTIFQIRPANSSEQTFLLERASTAAYIAYQRAGNPGDEADALAVLGRAMLERRLWRAAVGRLARSPKCALVTRKCATITVSGCSTIRSIPIRLRPGPVSSSPKTLPSAPTSRRLSRWPAT